MLKKSISIMMAIFMIAAVTTVSAFAAIDETIFYLLVDGEYVPATSVGGYEQAQHSVTSAVNDDGDVTIAFDSGPVTLPAVGGGVGQYYGVVSATSGEPDANVVVAGDYTNSTQTVSYNQVDDYVPITFTITFVNVVPNGPNSTIPHPPQTSYVNVPE
jgi:hypothetical protein